MAGKVKILLIYPYMTLRFNWRIRSVEPLGILSLAAYLNRLAAERALPVEVAILDAQMEGPETCIQTAGGFRSGMSDDQIREYVVALKPDVVGITCNYTLGLNSVLEMVATIKGVLPGCLMVLGGAHATIDHLRLAARPDVDAVVRSEGEVTFAELVQAVCEGTSFAPILGLTYCTNGHVVANEDRPLVEDVNTLPIPDRSLIPYETYLRHSSQHYFHPLRKPVATMFSARGCPHTCIFCSTQKVWRNCWRPRSAERVLEEIDQLTERYGVKEIAFQDDQFIGNRKRVKELCRLLIEKKPGLSLIAPPGMSPALLDEETLALMVKAGFYRICLSIDVGTPAAAAFVRKPVNLENMRKVVKTANRLGLWTYATFVIGFPYEKEADILETIRFAYRLRLDHIIFYIAMPHLGSDLYDYYVKEGLLNETEVAKPHLPDESLFGTQHISAKRLEELRDMAARRYLVHHIRHFLNPAYTLCEFLPKIWTPRRFAYFMRLVFAMLPDMVRRARNLASSH
ncbi:MAG: B12-binding domain-containing radical SAM protein [Lentisphaerae bacterium]|nr:B12-binding domain-containing radical SAM protein [Lentisphaerota bacterium]